MGSLHLEHADLSAFSVIVAPPATLLRERQEARLREFRIDSVTGGQDALGEASVVLELAGQSAAGQGVSTDIIEAAAQAYVRALSNAERKVQAVALNDVTPNPETISNLSYPGARQIYIYVKGQHLDVIPGLKEFLAEYARAWSEGGYLAERGLIPSPAGSKPRSTACSFCTLRTSTSEPMSRIRDIAIWPATITERVRLDVVTRLLEPAPAISIASGPSPARMRAASATDCGARY